MKILFKFYLHLKPNGENPGLFIQLLEAIRETIKDILRTIRASWHKKP